MKRAWVRASQEWKGSYFLPHYIFMERIILMGIKDKMESGIRSSMKFTLAQKCYKFKRNAWFSFLGELKALG